MRLRLRGWHELYYAATIAFAVLDGVAGANLRAVGFAAAPGLRALYYLACLGCFALIRLRPGWAPAVTVAETSVNLVVLCVAVLGAPLLMVEGPPGEQAVPRLPELLANFAICGTAGIIAFHQNLARLGAQLRELVG